MQWTNKRPEHFFFLHPEKCNTHPEASRYSRTIIQAHALVLVFFPSFFFFLRKIKFGCVSMNEYRAQTLLSVHLVYDIHECRTRTRSFLLRSSDDYTTDFAEVVGHLPNTDKGSGSQCSQMF